MKKMVKKFNTLKTYALILLVFMGLLWVAACTSGESSQAIELEATVSEPTPDGIVDDTSNDALSNTNTDLNDMQNNPDDDPDVDTQANPNTNLNDDTGSIQLAQNTPDCDGIPASSEGVAIESSPRIEIEKSALGDRYWDGFSPLVDPSYISSGGPPPDGIPPIDEPTFLSPEEVDFLADTEPVISLEINCEVKAYPVQILTWHEIVNDVLGGVPVTVTYCPLCNSAVTYDRRLNDLILDFGTSGLLYNSSLVMYDRQSETLWTHYDGQAIIGELEGEKLDFYPISIVSWKDWKSTNPDGLVLDRVYSNGRTIRDYGRNPYGGYLLNENPLSYGFLNDEATDDRLAIKELVVGVRSVDNADAVAIVRDTLVEKGTVDVQLGDRELTAWHISGTNSALDSADITYGIDIGSVAVFERNLDGTQLDFERVGGTFQDQQTSSTWNIFGEAISGELKGKRLTAVEFLDTFWFAWVGFNPDTQIIT